MTVTPSGFRKSVRALGYVAAFAVVAGCTRIERFHGFTPTDAELSAVQVGQSTKSGVIANFGPPFSDGSLENNAVYYVSSQFSYCLLYTSPSPRDLSTSRMPSSA